MKIQDAKICMDCDEIFPIHHETCPACGSRSFHWLAYWIKPMWGVTATKKNYQEELSGTH